MEFPLEIFIGLLTRHLETFRLLEVLQVKALDGMKGRGVEGLAAMLASQQEVLVAIAREKAELKPLLDSWETLDPARRGQLREGRAGEILDALEAVAKSIQARHQEMFGDDPKETNPAAAPAPAAASGQDLSQTINLYRSLQ